MIHTEFEPLPELRGDIKCFWIMEVSQAAYNQADLLPDPYVPLVINCGAPLLLQLENGKEIELPQVMVGGLQGTPLRVRALGTVRHVAICLYPWALHTLLGVSIRIANTSMVRPSGIWDDLAQTIAAIVSRQGYAEAVDYLQRCVSDLYRPNTALAPIRAAGERLYAAQGSLRMGELAAACYVSPSQLERRFNQFVGISPKAFARLVRFNALRDSLLHDPSIRPLELALNFGYSDQAHLIREFKTFAACTPGEYIARLRGALSAQQDAEILQYG